MFFTICTAFLISHWERIYLGCLKSTLWSCKSKSGYIINCVLDREYFEISLHYYFGNLLEKVKSWSDEFHVRVSEKMV